MGKSLRLLEYCRRKAQMTGQPYKVKPHIVQITTAIEQLVTNRLPGGKRNLMLNISPRWSKTTTVCNAIEWATGLIPDSEWLYLSYGAELAEEQTANIRNTIRAPWFQDTFPRCRLRVGQGRKDRFKTTESGIVYGTGFGGSITGFGAGKDRPGFGGFIAIDDPIKPQEARRSATMREKCVQDYTGTITTRRNTADTPILLMMQRTSPDDLCGWILKNEPHLWHQVKVPALDPATGESGWPERITAEQLAIMKEVDPFAFWSQYQQEPINPGGCIFKEEWFYEYDDRDQIIRMCDFFMIFADTAMKKEAANDWSVFQLWGFQGSQRAFLIDQIRGKWEFPDLIKHAKEFWEKHGSGESNGTGAMAMYIEDKVSGTSLIQTLQREDIPVMEWVRKDYDVTNDDKVSAARDISYSIYGGRVWIPSPNIAPWIDDWMDEVKNFSDDMSHTWDDQVDPMVMAVLTWKQYGGGVGDKAA